MKSKNYLTGRNAEALATKALVEKGYVVLENNFRNRFGEIDIIAKDKETLVFVEVKAKTGQDFGLPEEMISRGKLQKVKNMAVIYLKGENVKCRIDVVAVVLSETGDLVRLTHYENVYM